MVSEHSNDSAMMGHIDLTNASVREILLDMRETVKKMLDCLNSLPLLPRHPNPPGPMGFSCHERNNVANCLLTLFFDFYLLFARHLFDDYLKAMILDLRYYANAGIEQWSQAIEMHLTWTSIHSSVMGIILDMATILEFPVPLVVAVHQQLILVLSLAHEDKTNLALVRVCGKVYGVNILDVANVEKYDAEQIEIEIIYDVDKPTLKRFAEAGGNVGNSSANEGTDIKVLTIIVTNEVQAEGALYGEPRVVVALSFGSTVILCSNVSPEFVSKLEHHVKNEGKNVKLVYALISGVVKRASMGALMIMASKKDEALESEAFVLATLSEKLYVIRGGRGSGRVREMVNQSLAGVHITAAAEIMVFGVLCGRDTKLLFSFISNSSATSLMFENGVHDMIDNEYTLYSVLDIFVENMGSATRWSCHGEAGVEKVYKTIAIIKVEGKLPALSKEVIFQSFLSKWPQDALEDFHRLNRSNTNVLVFLNDAPTGPQTANDIEVITEWSVEPLVQQFKKYQKYFFILLNSRSLNSERASELIKDISRDLQTVIQIVANTDYTVVLRGDSILGGHFLEEATQAVVSILDAVSVLGVVINSIPCKGVILTAITYTTLIIAYGRAGKGGKSLKLYAQMKVTRCVPTVSNHNIILSMLGNESTTKHMVITLHDNTMLAVTGNEVSAYDIYGIEIDAAFSMADFEEHLHSRTLQLFTATRLFSLLGTWALLASADAFKFVGEWLRWLYTIVIQRLQTNDFSTLPEAYNCTAGCFCWGVILLADEDTISSGAKTADSGSFPSWTAVSNTVYGDEGALASFKVPTGAVIKLGYREWALDERKSMGKLESLLEKVETARMEGGELTVNLFTYLGRGLLPFQFHFLPSTLRTRSLFGRPVMLGPNNAYVGQLCCG